MYDAPKLYPIACVLVPNFIRFELGHKEVDLDLSSQILGPLSYWYQFSWKRSIFL